MTTPTPDPLARLLAEAPFVRELARTLLAEETDEIVQDTWLRALRRWEVPVREPRHWLGRIARNVAHNLRRAIGTRRALERAAAAGRTAADAVPSSAELMLREESRRALVLAVDALPEELRSVVLLRYFENLPPRAIAQAAQVPVATVWNRLRRAHQLLRSRLDADHGGDRRAWLLPLIPFAGNGGPAGAPAAATLVRPGVIGTTTKARLLAGAVVVMLCAAVAWSVAAPHVGAPPRAPNAAAATAVRADDRQPPPERQRDTEADRVAATARPAASTGALLVHCVRGSDRTPAADVLVVAAASDAPPRLGRLRARSDAAGLACFPDLEPGAYELGASTNRGATASCRVAAGGTAECELQLPPGIDIDGVVVDDIGAAVAGAEVLLGPLADAERDVEPATQSGPDGRFALRDCARASLIGARAAGRAPSPLQFLYGRPGRRFDVRIVLPGSGGDLEGEVVDRDGRPLAGAVVRVGRGRLAGIDAGDHGAPPPPAQVDADASGHFRAEGLPAGEQPLVARAAGCAPWTGSCVVPLAGTAHVRAVLDRGVRCTGHVFAADGRGVPGAEVRVGVRTELAFYRARTAADGAFALDGLPPGECELAASHPEAGKATARIAAGAGAAVACDLVLSRGVVLRGAVQFAPGEPLAGARVYALPAWAEFGERDAWQAAVVTDGAGRFAVDNCPEAQLLHLFVVAANCEPIERCPVDPAAGECALAAVRSPAKTAHVRGTVVGPDAAPVARAVVWATRPDGREHPAQTEGDGTFDIGPLAPGALRVHVESSDFAPLAVGERELGEGSTWDVGTVQLRRGGTVRVRLGDADPDGLQLRLWDAGNRPIAIDVANPELRSPTLAEGRYRVQLAGPECAAAGADVLVHGGEETVVDLPVRRGVAVAFDFPGADAAAAQHVEVRVSAGSELVLRTRIPAQRSRPPALRCRLLPGSYTVAATAGEWSGRAAFAVPATGDGVRVRVARD